jgi:hypothetical protein
MRKRQRRYIGDTTIWGGAYIAPGRRIMGKEKLIELLTYMEASELSGVNHDTLSSRVRNGSLCAYHRKGKTYIVMADISEWQPTWKRDHDTVILQAHTAGESDVAMASMLGLSRERVRQIRNNLGLPANPLKPRLAKTIAPKRPVSVLEVLDSKIIQDAYRVDEEHEN